MIDTGALLEQPAQTQEADVWTNQQRADVIAGYDINRRAQDIAEGRTRDILDKIDISTKQKDEIRSLLADEDRQITWSTKVDEELKRNAELERVSKDKAAFEAFVAKIKRDPLNAIIKEAGSASSYGSSQESKMQAARAREATISLVNRLETSIKGLDQAVVYANSQGYEGQLARTFLNHLLAEQLKQPGVNLDAVMKNLEPQIAEVANALTELRVHLNEEPDPAATDEQKNAYVKRLHDLVGTLSKKNIAGLNLSDFDTTVFKEWTVKDPEFNNTENPKTMAALIQQAAKFHGEDKWGPNGKYPLYKENSDGTVSVDVGNVYLLIIKLVQWQMYFQGPDAQIQPFELRIAESTYRVTSLFDFLYNDANKYSQEVGIDGKLYTNEKYANFLLYTVLKLSSSAKNFNFGVDARNALPDEKAWVELYDKNLLQNELATSNRSLRDKRALSAREVKWYIDNGFSVGEMFDVDGQLGRAESKVTSLYAHLLELSDIKQIGGKVDYTQKPPKMRGSHDSWDISAHIQAIKDEMQFYNDNRIAINQLRRKIAATKKGQEATRLQDQLVELLKQQEEARNRQNYFFRALGSEEQIRDFLVTLTEGFMNQELRQDYQQDVRQLVSQKELSHPSGTFKFFDVLHGLEGKAAQQSLIGILVRRGMKMDSFLDYRNGAKDAGVFFRELVNLSGNHYKQESLNIYSQLGVAAKGAIKGVLESSVQDYIEKNYTFKKVLVTDKTGKTTELEVGLQDKEIEYVMEAGQKTPDWMMKGLDNDSGVSGNNFDARILHMYEYWKKNATKLPIGLKETIDVIKNTQTLWDGMPVKVLVEDEVTHEQWWEMTWLGDFMDREMNEQVLKQKIVKAEFPNEAFATFRIRRFKSILHMYEGRKNSKEWGVYNPVGILLGYSEGQPYVDNAAIQAYLKERNYLADEFFDGKFPQLHKNAVRVWRKNDATGELEAYSTITERYQLGDEVFLLDPYLSQVPDIENNPDWERGNQLASLTELALVGKTLRHRLIKHLPAKMREGERDFPVELNYEGIKDIIWVMTKTQIGGMNLKFQPFDDPHTGSMAVGRDGQPILSPLYEGDRYTQELMERMFQLITRVPIEHIREHEQRNNTNMLFSTLLLGLIGMIIQESIQLKPKK